MSYFIITYEFCEDAPEWALNHILDFILENGQIKDVIKKDGHLICLSLEGNGFEKEKVYDINMDIEKKSIEIY